MMIQAVRVLIQALMSQREIVQSLIVVYVVARVDPVAIVHSVRSALAAAGDAVVERRRSMSVQDLEKSFDAQ
jgi:predicted DNA-binding transcriptional regulator